VSGVNWLEMPYYYSSADLVISLSSNDSLPNTMLEAMACNIPVIMGDIPQIREWVIGDINGKLCPVRNTDNLYEEIMNILENKDNCIKNFTEYNRGMISKNFNSKENIKVIKDLVISIKDKH
jgi:glycosyltransferase involved in cell wall biosynthesis